MNQSALTLLLERLGNIENRIGALENELITYMEFNPKGDSQWFEQRLRALEEEIKMSKVAGGHVLSLIQGIKAQLNDEEPVPISTLFRHPQKEST